MIVELKPETERLVQEEIQKGRVRSIDDLIVRGVRALHEEQAAEVPKPRKSLYELLSQPPFAGSDLMIEREKDYPRPVSL
jgi:Arc/MetJ-type ribon-helix-helix transcriptional regulator